MLKKLLLKIQKSQFVTSNARCRMLGEGTIIRSDCYFTGDFIKMGKGCVINNFCKFYSHIHKKSMIELGDNVLVAPNVIFAHILT